MFVYIVNFDNESAAEKAFAEHKPSVKRFARVGNKIYCHLTSKSELDAFKSFLVDCDTYTGFDKEYADELKETMPNLFKEA